MTKSILTKTLLAFTLTLSLAACKKDNDEVKLAANEFDDAAGLRTTVNWTLTSGGNAAAGADLDVYLLKGTGTNLSLTQYGSEESNTSSESFLMPSSLENGDYTVVINYFEVLENGSMNFTLKGESGSKTFTVNNLAFTTQDEDDAKPVLQINKNGNKFTVTKL